MVRHIVMYWFDSDEKLKQAEEALVSMRGKIEGMEELQVGRDFMQSPRSCQLCLLERFTSREALRAYIDHPVHLPVKALMHSIVTRSCSADFDE